ncbi:bifunctional heptose 7-phosphate kinase/heptose 1-phosphate adenyltransferase [Poseidonibacter parvus]|uniref:Bifunctional protein HldE n=1 Tax=Poseidonibacter parvus TaxID=1850254 RepID=A0A1P8KNL2_9BACT|nr:D-glycero-beta-D-manno-heptose-7-phosphate kinase [Poseidonibacter parvus]APW66131.1 bifunctional heptose 7-phosphate kinase/heptose 1-phosphate adenyltransferase [Poseidonibacter parvus]
MINLKNKKPNILVIGDLMIDHYLWGSCERISPEAPVPVINIQKENQALGGAGNVLNNLKTFGAKVSVISVLGNDSIASELKEMLENIDIQTNMLIEEENRKTTKKSRLIASQQQVLRYDKESTQNISDESASKILEFLTKNISKYDVLLLSDYGKGVLTKKLTQEIISISNENKVKVFVDPKGNDYDKYKNAYAITPNKKEAIEATNIDIKDDSTLEKAIKELKTNYQLDLALITLSESGIAIYDDKLRIKPTVAKEVYDVTGAGDTVIASIAFAIANGLDIDKAVEFANLAAGVVVSKIGSATASMDEIYEYESSLHKSNSFSNIKNIDEIKAISKRLINQKKKIVFTNGCFDILHAGHVKYLEEAKSYGDILILGLNSDDSVRRLKGSNRPINNQEDRAYLLAALDAVDFVVIFNEETPYELIKLIQPDLLVKGGDYIGKTVVGKDIAKEVKLVEFVENKSTTKIIQRILNNAEND